MKSPKWPRLFIPLASFLTLFQSACKTTHGRHPKTAGPKEPERYEAPFEQQYSDLHQNSLPTVKTLSAENNTLPQIIEPDLADPNEPEILEAIAVKGKPNMVLSPYILTNPNRSKLSGLIDTTDFPAGSKVRCPYTGKIMRIPLPVETENKRDIKADSKTPPVTPPSPTESGSPPTENPPKPR
jgi:hypothetical protein